MYYHCYEYVVCNVDFEIIVNYILILFTNIMNYVIIIIQKISKGEHIRLYLSIAMCY